MTILNNISTKNTPVNVLSDRAYKEIAEASLNKIQERPISPESNKNQDFVPFKTHDLISPRITKCIEHGSSFIVTDPEGKLFSKTSHLAEDNGYKVRVLDLTRPDISDGWNPFDTFKDADIRSHEFTALDMTNIILSHDRNYYADRGGCKEANIGFFEETLLRNVIMYVASPNHFLRNESDRNIGTVYDILKDLASKNHSEELDRQPADEMSGYFWKVNNERIYNLYEFASGIMEKIDSFRSGVIRDMLSCSEIDPATPVKAKCAYYVIPAGENEMMNNLASLFFSCEFRALRQEAEAGKAEVPVLVMMSGLENMQWIPNLPMDAKESADHGISVMIAVKDIDKIKNIYGEEVEDFLDICDIIMI